MSPVDLLPLFMYTVNVYLLLKKYLLFILQVFILLIRKSDRHRKKKGPPVYTQICIVHPLVGPSHKKDTIVHCVVEISQTYANRYIFRECITISGNKIKPCNRFWLTETCKNFFMIQNKTCNAVTFQYCSQVFS